jgi:hypothetical protein
MSIFFKLFLLTSPLIVYGITFCGINIRFSRLFLILAALNIFCLRLSFNKVLIIDYFNSLIVIFAFCGLLWTPSVSQWVVKFFGFLECILIYYLTTLYCVDKNSLVRAVLCYLYSSFFVVFVCLWQLYNLLTSNIDAKAIPFAGIAMLNYYERLNDLSAFGIAGNISRLSGPFNDPNMLAGYISSIVLLLTTLFLKRISQIKYKYLICCYYCFLVFILMLTFSKSGLLSFLAGMLTLAFLGRAFRVLLMFIAVAVASYLIYLFFPEMVDARISAGDSGHLEFMEQTLHSLYSLPLNDLLLGSGFGGAEQTSTHRLLFTLVAELGIFGLLYWLLISTRTAYILFYGYCIKNKSNSKLLAVSLIASLVSIIVGLNLYDYFLYPFVWIIFAFGDSILRLRFRSTLN